jgi:hypothetical protein
MSFLARPIPPANVKERFPLIAIARLKVNLGYQIWRA